MFVNTSTYYKAFLIKLVILFMKVSFRENRLLIFEELSYKDKNQLGKYLTFLFDL